MMIKPELPTSAQSRQPTPASDVAIRESTIIIHTSCLFHPRTKAFLPNRTIRVSSTTGLITSITTRRDSSIPNPKPLSPNEHDLRHLCVIPGLVDAHAHVFLHAYKGTPAIVQMRDESLVERILRASNHCRDALTAGYTTYRDLGTEGAGEADIGVRDAVNRGIIPGPRLLVATEALASSGSYETRQENKVGGTSINRISDPCDGVDGVRAAVRRRIGAGADVIKFYADYRRRVQRFPAPIAATPGQPTLDLEYPPQYDRNPNITNFTQEEMNAIVAEAKLARCPVAAHAQGDEAARMAAIAGVTTIEHAPFISDETMNIMLEHNIIWVPTLSVIELFSTHAQLDEARRKVKKAWSMGIRLAAGGDTGAFPHGENARELELLRSAGIPAVDVLRAATLGGYEAAGGEWSSYRFGSVEEGWVGDLVGLSTDPREDERAWRKVDFVMKNGRVWKKDRKVVGMERWL